VQSSTTYRDEGRCNILPGFIELTNGLRQFKPRRDHKNNDGLEKDSDSGTKNEQ